MRAEERAAEHRGADFARVNGELRLLGAAHGWQRGRANGHLVLEGIVPKCLMVLQAKVVGMGEFNGKLK